MPEIDGLFKKKLPFSHFSHKGTWNDVEMKWLNRFCFSSLYLNDWPHNHKLAFYHLPWSTYSIWLTSDNFIHKINTRPQKERPIWNKNEEIVCSEITIKRNLPPNWDYKSYVKIVSFIVSQEEAIYHVLHTILLAIFQSQLQFQWKR